jgi:hypothetical protein
MERVEAQVNGMPHDGGLRIQGHHHTCRFLSEVVHTIRIVQNDMSIM